MITSVFCNFTFYALLLRIVYMCFSMVMFALYLCYVTADYAAPTNGKRTVYLPSLRLNVLPRGCSTSMFRGS